MKPQDAIKEFEDLLEIAELKALSRLSLEQPLTDKQFIRMKELFWLQMGAIKQ
jgi:hypothetical protein